MRFKAVPFLNFFFARIEPLPTIDRDQVAEPVSAPAQGTHWAEEPEALARVTHGATRDDPYGANWQPLWTALASEGFAWLSKCQGEWNVIHAVDTPIVFRSLRADGTLYYCLQ
ncbi:hypothetical protein MVES1_000784 [Malassezia vespertilionis]|uniref:uncharacterized protein n=1 Tax=Malassezia vespertilionis TaxID=2020962 RepID=UPI0024B043DF|nr:uncharacterized protein MVES1_000784 [Malassezia vespertilionis]WFD05454.1 hypothetical protein MVES1_000784 [Malassezia vespertilionis]